MKAKSKFVFFIMYFYTHKICNKRKHINVSYNFFNPLNNNIIYLLYGNEKHYGNLYDCNLLFDYQNKLLYKISKIKYKNPRTIFNYYSKEFSV